MDLNRYVDLFIAESQEHLRVMNRALLELESGEREGALEEVFRAAHTIKGAAAALGLETVAERAHILENRLETVRAGERTVDAELIDDLLAGADTLEQEIEEALSGAGVGAGAAGPADEDAADRGDGPAAAGTDEVEVPSGTEIIARVELRRDTPLKAARAMMVASNAEAAVDLVGTHPEKAEIDDDFDGVLRLFIGADADRGALEEAIRAAGDVERVVFEDPTAGGTDGDEADRDSRTRGRHFWVDQERLDELAAGIGELAILWGRMRAILPRDADGTLEQLADRADRLVDDLQHAALDVRMEPVAHLFDRFPRVVRDAARALGKNVDFEVEGREIRLDRSILDEIGDPMVHLLRNAVDHGIESPENRQDAGKPERGRLQLRATRERAGVRIAVEDDGSGVDRAALRDRAEAAGLEVPESADDLTDGDVLRILSHAGVTTAEEVTEVSGRGVGMDAVVERVRGLGGTVEMETRAGEGTTFTIRLPLTLAVAEALRVQVGGEDYAIPMTHVSEAVELEDVTVARVRGKEVLRIRDDDVVPLVWMRSVLDVGEDGRERAAVVVETGRKRTALVVDELIGHEQIVVKSFDAAVGTLPIFSGVTILPDGRPALVLDPTSVT